MEGETNLQVLLDSAAPVLNPGKYVFCTSTSPSAELKGAAIVSVREAEGVTLVLPQDLADSNDMDYDYVASWITLRVHSSLAAVGLTAAFSRALAKQNISSNVVAGYYHDHIFVGHKDTDLAMAVLSSLATQL